MSFCNIGAAVTNTLHITVTEQLHYYNINCCNDYYNRKPVQLLYNHRTRYSRGSIYCEVTSFNALHCGADNSVQKTLFKLP